jgi:hypothetical protein
MNREKADRMVGARGESMLAILEAVEKEWGGRRGMLGMLLGLVGRRLRGLGGC